VSVICTTRAPSAEVVTPSSSHAGSVPPVLRRPPVLDSVRARLAASLKRAAGEVVLWGWDAARELGAIGPRSRRGRRFGHFGDRSVICFPATALVNERYIHVGTGTIIGSHVTLSAGMVPGQHCVTDPVVRIGDRCLIGRGSGIVGHLSIEIDDDVWTGHYVYITDQNHGYADLDQPISAQSQPERPVRIGAGSWLGHGTVVLPGATIGRHVVIGANSVVRGEIPDNCIAAGNPAVVVKRLDSSVSAAETVALATDPTAETARG
jgi:acetyltransferase-like isoleucine patch superfamily enzyme